MVMRCPLIIDISTHLRVFTPLLLARFEVHTFYENKRKYIEIYGTGNCDLLQLCCTVDTGRSLGTTVRRHNISYVCYTKQLYVVLME
jgi:hypothetical protein